ncbi:helix-turn-helix transcriptional regulator [Promicromonospora sp. NFX87]|uniref:helix-turn-helix transcriptional regulator n=1 Tax=Promicromonospora sp. NFX87 TaxID=3402691 RepID=UPI003AFAC03D
MDLENAFEPVLTMSELAATLRVSTQAIYDLRRTGRGPRAIRVGKELRFRRSEVEAWLVQMENEDAAVVTRSVPHERASPDHDWDLRQRLGSSRFPQNLRRALAGPSRAASWTSGAGDVGVDR